METNEWCERIAVAAFVVDDHGRICAANQAFKTLAGVAGEVVGAPLEDFAQGSVRSSDFARAKLKRPDGLELEVVYRAFPVAIAPRLDVVLVSSVAESATDPKAGSDRPPRQPETDRVYKAIFQHSPVGILHFDARGIVTACNDVILKILGSSARQVVGIDLATLPTEEIRAAIMGSLAGSTTLFAGDYVSLTGQKHSTIRAEFAPIFDEGGAIIGGVGLVQDVTEQRAAERAHERADRMASLATLAAGTVHEMQDPLALMVTSLDLALRLIQTQAKAGADQVELATAIAAAREGAGQITDLTQGLSAFARGDDALRAPVDVERALDAAIALVRPSFRDKATLERSYESVPRVRAIERKLVQLFKSLLQNAGDAIEPGSKDRNRISIGVRRLKEAGAGEQVEVVIRDTGHGLSDEARAHLFEPFFTHKPGALGLGLAAAHGIARSFGGELTLTESSEKGSAFTLVFPVSEAPVEATPSTAPPARTSGRAHLLVIDDEERLAETLRMALAYSHDVTIATSGSDALAKIRGGTHPFDLVLCDLFLPDISGPDIYAEVQRTRPDLLARFVFLTGGAFTESARRFLQNIDNPRLEKPFDLGALEDLISERLALFAR